MPDDVALPRCQLGLTPGQTRVLRLVAVGWTQGDIAPRLWLSEAGVRMRTRAARERYGVHHEDALSTRELAARVLLTDLGMSPEACAAWVAAYIAAVITEATG